jgi:hypothetical protein
MQRPARYTGEIVGAVAYLGYYPKTGAVVAIMANDDGNTSIGQNIAASTVFAIHSAIPGLLGLVH